MKDAYKLFSHSSVCRPTSGDLGIVDVGIWGRLVAPLSVKIRVKQSALETKKTYSIYSKWKQVDSCRNDCLIMDQEYLISFRDRFEAPQLLYSSSGTVTSFSSCCSHAGKSETLLWDIEQDHLRAIFVEYAVPGSMIGDTEAMKASANIPGTFVHLFCSKSGKKLKTIQLPTEKSKSLPAVHGKVYRSGDPSEPFASCRFCPTNPNKIVYLAEYSRTVGGKDPSGSAIGGIPERSPFIFEENWGEGLGGTSRPVMFLLDLETEEVVSTQPILEKLVPEANHWSFDDPHYTPDGKGIVFVAYDNDPYRLGLKYCYQRVARLMYWEFETSTLQCLSHDNHAVRWPRFSPDGSKLVWFEMPAGGPHGQCFAMIAQQWPPNQFKSEVVVPLIAMVKERSDFPGLYLCDGVPERCWTADSKGVVLSTIWGAEKALIHVSLDSSPLERIFRFPSPLADVENGGGYGTVTLMDIINNVLAVDVSSPTVPNFLAVAKISSESVTKTSWLSLNLTGDQQPIVSYLKGLAWKVLEHAAKTEDTRFGVTRFESILVYPLLDSSSLQFSGGSRFKGQEVTWESTRGLIVFPHGGPHSAFTAEWLPLLASYIAAGFACLLVNYRGSVGYGNSSIYSLPGKCGTIDVADCVQATEEALCELNNPDLPCVLLGGSHGGFLVLHLAGRHASLYRAVVARNPVTNLLSMLSTTDIPDWCWTEAGIGLDNVLADPQHPDHLCHACAFASNFCPTDPEHLSRLVACSPIIHISSKWSVPILMCIGAKDQRVPNEQGISFMRALRAHLGEGAGETMCQTLCFPTEAHPIQSPAASRDNFVRAVEWYYQALGLLKASPTTPTMDDGAFSDFLQNDDYDLDGPEWFPAARDSVIFLIDCTATMVSEKLPQVPVGAAIDTGLKLALLFCEKFMQKKALSSPNDMVGLVLMRMDTLTSSEFRGVNIFQNLDVIDAPRILAIEKIREMSSKQFVECYGHLLTGESYPIHEALWACQNIFNNAKKSLGYKRIFLLTDDPDPIGSKIQLKSQAILKANDLQQSGVEIKLIRIQQADVDFRMDTFYKHLLPPETEIDLPIVESSDHLDKLFNWSVLICLCILTSMDEMLNLMEGLRESKRHRLGRLPLYLVPMTPAALIGGAIGIEPSGQAPTLAFGVALYCPIRRVPPPRQVPVYAKTNEPITVKHRFYKGSRNDQHSRGVRADIRNLVMPQDIVRGLRVGNHIVHFGKSELAGCLRQVAVVGIHILGFKSLRKLKSWCQLKTAHFLFPEEGMAKGSTLWFTTLLSACLRKQVFAVALYMHHRGMSPRFVALVPQAERIDECGAQTAGPGFHVLYLPYREDFRRFKLPKHPPAKPEEVEAAKAMVKKMFTNYHPEAISNPSLQRHHAELEALALERADPRVGIDHTQPDLQRIKEYAGREIGQFANLLLQPPQEPSSSLPKVAPTVEGLSDHLDARAMDR
ncbi:Acylamino-acid-releasing enzyme [Taenia solium]|eukprot:TsM_001080000 transcript=TsM_001080000 gene=TsM_001080000